VIYKRTIQGLRGLSKTTRIEEEFGMGREYYLQQDTKGAVGMV
jgi:hypothetical protein